MARALLLLLQWHPTCSYAQERMCLCSIQLTSTSACQVALASPVVYWHSCNFFFDGLYRAVVYVEIRALAGQLMVCQHIRDFSPASMLASVFLPVQMPK